MNETKTTIERLIPLLERDRYRLARESGYTIEEYDEVMNKLRQMSRSIENYL